MRCQGPSKGILRNPLGQRHPMLEQQEAREVHLVQRQDTVLAALDDEGTCGCFLRQCVHCTNQILILREHSASPSLMMTKSTACMTSNSAGFAIVIHRFMESSMVKRAARVLLEDALLKCGVKVGTKYQLVDARPKEPRVGSAQTRSDRSPFLVNMEP